MLTIDALSPALMKWKPSLGSLHHSGRGSQYCSAVYQALLSKNGFICSMSGKSNCYDNAVIESFYHTLKVELIYGHPCRTKGEAQMAVFDYIEIFYNRAWLLQVSITKHLRRLRELLEVGRFFRGKIFNRIFSSRSPSLNIAENTKRL